MIRTSPGPIDVTYECRYSTSVSITSNEFAPETVSMHGETHATGTLTEGFAVNLTAVDDSPKFILGSRQEVAVSWTLSEAMAEKDITYVVEDSALTHNELDVEIVKDQCYSTVLKNREINRKFTFQQFKIRKIP